MYFISYVIIEKLGAKIGNFLKLTTVLTKKLLNIVYKIILRKPLNYVKIFVWNCRKYQFFILKDVVWLIC